MKSFFLVILSLVAFCSMMALPVLANADLAKFNLSAGEKFLAEKALEEGVVKTSSGLLYKVVTKGDSTLLPSRTDKVKVHYRGTLINGNEFDSSYKRNSPLVFGVNQVVKGFSEALQLMSPGDKFELYLHPDLAYGARGAGRDIGPNAALIFELELLEVVGKKPKEDL
eukprot:TRINITY_DN95637_c0_g1_i1.p1 TRINITY_DN95637_c0_g1~~TRINITY_DN95637_c0_g1_i1.p1  ORF type:complete len:168 (+),score=35.47 TRINITY_DN95637_c0_g1_i1:31-534(+)